MESFNINLGNGVEYPVIISSKILENIEDHLSRMNISGEYYFIIDEYIYKKYINFFKNKYNGSSAYYKVVLGKKNNKTFFSVMQIFADLDDKNISRDITIVAVGGGVIGDLAGFVASCWYRGVKLVHFPTTLLAAVDSCVGGKTAINFKRSINAVGTYHHPISILVDTSLLYELPPREVSSGFGEIIKYAAIGNANIRKSIDIADSIANLNLETLVAECLREKERYVRGDIGESANRLFLNFGHTIGHAIEFSTLYNGQETLRHGEGVALGMVAIFRICVFLGLLKEADLLWLKGVLKKFSLPYAFEASKVGMSAHDLQSHVNLLCFKDKKRTSKLLRLVLLDGIGKPIIYKTSDKELISRGIKEVII